MSVRPISSSMRSVCATSALSHASPVTTVMPEHVCLRRLDQQQHRLLVRAGRTGRVLVDDDLAFALTP